MFSDILTELTSFFSVISKTFRSMTEKKTQSRKASVIHADILF